MFLPVVQPFQFIQGGNPATVAPTTTANASTTAERIDHLRDRAIAVEGTFAGDVDVKVRATPASSWITLATISNGPGIYFIPNNAPLHDVELVVKNYGSGTISGTFLGRSAQA